MDLGNLQANYLMGGAALVAAGLVAVLCAAWIAWRLSLLPWATLARNCTGNALWGLSRLLVAWRRDA